MLLAIVFLLFVPVVPSAVAFSVHPQQPQSRTASASTLLAASSSDTATDLLSLSLAKPLGLILEEVEENKACGVYVLDFADAGSALDFKSDLKGCTLATVQGQDVTQLAFDDVMEQIVNAPDTVDLQFLVDAADDSSSVAPAELPVGTKVILTVVDENNQPREISAKVGDNLRKTLLENDIAVYQGMKQTLGNCGGAGQCTFCAFDFSNDDAWQERSDYEDRKLTKLSRTARLTCLNSIQGPATIQKTKR